MRKLCRIGRAFFPFFTVLCVVIFTSSCAEKKYISPESAKKRFVSDYGKHLTKKHPSIQILHDISSREDHEFVGLKLMVQGEYTKQEALSLFHSLHQDFSSFAKNHSMTPLFFSPLNQSPLRCEFILSFWTDEMDRPHPEYASEIRLKKGSISYLHKEVGSEFLDLKDIYKESYYEFE